MKSAFKSEAQRAKFRQLVDEGKISAELFAEKEAASRGVSLPERAAPRPRTVGASRAPAAAQFGKTRY
jgi:hypothetical protein